MEKGDFLPSQVIPRILDEAVKIATNFQKMDADFGKVKLKIPQGIKSGQVLRLRGKGIPELNRKYFGDQLVKINIETPQKYSKKAKSLLEGLSSELKELVKFEKFQ